jgi:multisubunit Na+/H+ antiporter MnhC subunit
MNLGHRHGRSSPLTNQRSELGPNPASKGFVVPNFTPPLRRHGTDPITGAADPANGVGRRSPILPRSGELLAGDYADPIPQAVILTAIVIGLSIQALLLVVITQMARIDPSLNEASFEATDQP